MAFSRHPLIVISAVDVPGGGHPLLVNAKRLRIRYQLNDIRLLLLRARCSPLVKSLYNLPSSSTFYPRISTMPDRLYGISGSLQCLNRPQPSNYKVWVSKVCTLSLIIGSSWTDRWYFLNRLLIPINFPPPAICLWVDSSSLPLKRSTSEVIIDISWYLY